MGATSITTAAAGGLGTTSGGDRLAASIPVAKLAGRLQAAAGILAGRSAPGGCTDDCPCGRAAAVTAGAFVFPNRDGAGPVAVTTAGLPIVCTLDADGEDLAARVGEWQDVLAHATAREETADGVAVMFDHDIARTARLGRLLAAEHSCCSFASYHLSIDARGVRIEIQAPAEGRDALAALFGTGHPPADGARGGAVGPVA